MTKKLTRRSKSELSEEPLARPDEPESTDLGPDPDTMTSAAERREDNSDNSRTKKEPDTGSIASARTTTGTTAMLGSSINPTTPFNVGQYGIGQIPNLGMGYGQFNIPMQTPGLWTGQMGMPGIGIGQSILPGMQQFGMPGMQQFSMPGMPTIPGIGSSPGLGIGQSIPSVSPYSLLGGLNPQLGNLFGGANIYGGIGQTPQAFGMPGLNPFGGLFGGLNPFNPFNPFNIPALPTFTVHSVAVITPSIDPLAQLVKHISQGGLLNGGILNPYDPFNPLAQLGLGQQPWQQGQIGQLNPFAFGAQGLLQPGIQQPFAGGRQVVRAYVQTMMGLIPIDLVV